MKLRTGCVAPCFTTLCRASSRPQTEPASLGYVGYWKNSDFMVERWIFRCRSARNLGAGSQLRRTLSELHGEVRRCTSRLTSSFDYIFQSRDIQPFGILFVAQFVLLIDISCLIKLIPSAFMAFQSPVK